MTLRNFRAGSSTGKPIISPPIEMFIVVEGQPAAPTLCPRRYGFIPQLPESVQSRDMDTLSIGATSGREDRYLCFGWAVGSDVKFRASVCGVLHR